MRTNYTYWRHYLYHNVFFQYVVYFSQYNYNKKVSLYVNYKNKNYNIVLFNIHLIIIYLCMCGFYP